jgi:O-antigen ligase
VVGGSLLVGALGLHLPAALMGRGRMRMIAAAAALITLLGIFATGTRGAWLAAAALCLGGVCTAIARIRPRRRMLAAIAAALLVSGLAGAAVWMASGDGVKRRLEQASTEITRALKHQDYDSDTGARLRMARLAIQAVREHPVRGLGAGGFRPFMAEQLKSEPSSARIHAHAHNAFLHIAATTGLPGLLLAAAIMFTAIRGGLAGLGREGLGTYAAGPAFALLGLLLVSPFDPVHLNAQTGAFLATLFALCLESRPAPKPLPWGRRTGPAG